MSFASYLREQAKANEKPKYQFRTFYPYKESRPTLGIVYISATQALNEWLEENPNIEIIDWKPCHVGDHSELYITIQYKELEE